MTPQKSAGGLFKKSQTSIPGQTVARQLKKYVSSLKFNMTHVCLLVKRAFPYNCLSIVHSKRKRHHFKWMQLFNFKVPYSRPKAKAKARSLPDRFIENQT